MSSSGYSTDRDDTSRICFDPLGEPEAGRAALVLHKQAIDNRTPDGRTDVLFAELEREMIRGRVIAELERARREACVSAGREPAPRTRVMHATLPRRGRTMYDRTVAIPTEAGQMETFITHPEEGGPFPAVVIYMDFWGVREELFDIAHRVGTVGYYCMVPDLYYRQGRVRHEWRNEKNQMISMHNLDPERQREAMVPLEKLSNAMVIEDTGALLQFVDRGEPVRPGGIGSMGYCMGGRHVLCVAGAYPDRFVAGASLHGTALVSDRDDFPHRLAHRFRGELY